MLRAEELTGTPIRLTGSPLDADNTVFLRSFDVLNDPEALDGESCATGSGAFAPFAAGIRPICRNVKSGPRPPWGREMKAILSDIHGNLEALQAVLADIEARGIEEVICLGDVIGYGPSPRVCLELVRDADILLLGNHEDALLSGQARTFNRRARRSMDWTREQLWGEDVPEEEAGEARRIFARFKLRATDPDDEAVLYVHGSPRNPAKEYVTPRDSRDARKMGAIFEMIGRVCFVGHTHVPGVFVRATDEERHNVMEPPMHADGRRYDKSDAAPRGGDNVVDPTSPRGGDNVVDPTSPRGGDNVVDPTSPRGGDNAVVPTAPCIGVHRRPSAVAGLGYSYSSPADLFGVYICSGEKALVNVGSVGQPRDRDPRACYVTFDMDTVVYHRVEYDVEAVVARIRASSALDDSLGERLRLGR